MSDKFLYEIEMNIEEKLNKHVNKTYHVVCSTFEEAYEWAREKQMNGEEMVGIINSIEDSIEIDAVIMED